MNTTTLCPKCKAPTAIGLALMCRATGVSDADISNDVVTMSPDPRQPILIQCLKCTQCGHSVSNPPA